MSLEVIETIKVLAEKDAFGFALSIVGVIVSISALYFQRVRSKENLSLQKIIHDMEVQLADARLFVKDLPEEERLEAIEKL